MAITDDFTTRFEDEFEEAQITTYLPRVLPMWPAYYGGTYTEESPSDAQALENETILQLLAHLVVLEESQPARTAWQRVQSRGVGPLSISFNQMDNSLQANFFMTTKYGNAFYTMIQRNCCRGLLV